MTRAVVLRLLTVRANLERLQWERRAEVVAAQLRIVRATAP